MAFAMSRVQDAIWPEIMGVVTYAGGVLVGAAIDAAAADRAIAAGKPPPYPWGQTLVSWGTLGGGAYGIGVGASPDFSRGLFFASGVGITVNLVRDIYQRVSAAPLAQTDRISDVFALVPRKMATVAARSSGQTITRRTLITTKGGGGGDGAEYVLGGVPAGVATGLRYE